MTEAPPHGVLVVGYGNALRTDDGVGWHVAGRLAADPRLDGAEVLQLHQLTPELALDVSRAGFVVFIDASRDAPGLVSVAPIPVDPDPGPDPTLAWTHHVGPALLLALSCDLYGRAPEAVTVSVGVDSVEAGDRLSAGIERILPEIVEVVVGLVVERGGSGAVGASSSVGGSSWVGGSGAATTIGVHHA